MNSDAPVATRGHWLLWAAGSWFAALALTFAGFVVHFHSGPWFAAAESYSISGSELAVRDKSRVLGSGVVMERAGEDGNAIAMRNFNVPLEARKFRILSVRAKGASPAASVTFAWRIRGDERTVRKIALATSGGGILPATLGSVDGWTGEVVSLALVVRGDFRAPLVIESLELHPSSVWTTIAGMASGWLEFEPWDGGSINFIAGGSSSQKHPLSLFVGITFVVATGLYLVLIALGHTRFKLQAALAIGLLCWAIVDLRWQINLWQQLQATRVQYAGKSWEQKRLAAEDGRLFAFMREVDARIGPAPAHVFVFADEEYDRVRGAYHLYPRNVSAQSKRQALLPAATFKAGDVLVVYRKRGVAYDPALKRLLWEGGQSLLADMVYVSDGAAVFRVLGPG